MYIYMLPVYIYIYKSVDDCQLYSIHIDHAFNYQPVDNDII